MGPGDGRGSPEPLSSGRQGRVTTEAQPRLLRGLVATARHPWFKRGTWGPASGERVGKAHVDTRGGGQGLAPRARQVEKGPLKRHALGGPQGLEGKGQIRGEKPRHTRTSRGCPTGNDSCLDLEIEVTSASNGHRPGQVTLGGSG